MKNIYRQIFSLIIFNFIVLQIIGCTTSPIPEIDLQKLNQKTNDIDTLINPSLTTEELTSLEKNCYDQDIQSCLDLLENYGRFNASKIEKEEKFDAVFFRACNIKNVECKKNNKIYPTTGFKHILNRKLGIVKNYSFSFNKKTTDYEIFTLELKK